MSRIPETRPNSGQTLRLAGTVLSLALMVYLLSRQGWNDIGQAIQKIPPTNLLLCLGLMVISRLAVAARWHVLLSAADPNLKYTQSLWLTFAGLYATNFLPTTIGGDVVRLSGAIQQKLDPMISAASLVVDRLVGMAGMLMVLPFGLPSFFAFSQAGRSPKELINLQATSLLAWSQKGWTRLTKLLKQLWEALLIWRDKPFSLLISLIFSGIHMLCFFGIMWLLFDGLGEQLSLWLIAGLYSLVYFVTLLPFSINGYGLQEISMTFVFSNLGGSSLQHALTVALLFRTLVMLASLPGAFFVSSLVHKDK